MSQTFTMSVPPPGKWDRFAPGALDSSVGNWIRIRRDGGFIEGIVKAAEVTQDGTECLVTVEIPEDGLVWPVVPPGARFSLTDFCDVQF